MAITFTNLKMTAGRVLVNAKNAILPKLRDVVFLLSKSTTNLKTNSVFLDSSVSATAITPVGQVAQVSYGPYTHPDGMWSTYFGTGTNILVAGNNSLHLSGDFTIEFWYMPYAAGGDIINKGGGLNIAWPSYLIRWTGSYIHFSASSTNTGMDIGSETGTISRIGAPKLHVWNHIVVSRQGNVWRGFLNGVKGFEFTSTLTPYNSAPRGLCVGGAYANTWGTTTPVACITGAVSNLRIVKGTALITGDFTPDRDRPLTSVPGTSLLLCQSNRHRDNSAYAHALQVTGATIYGLHPYKFDHKVPNINGGSFYSPAAGSLQYTAPGVGPGDFTIECWVFHNQANASVNACIYRNYVDPFSPNCIYFGKHPAYNGRVSFWAGNYNSTSTAILVDTSLPLQEWTHYAVVKSGATWRMYRNGAVVATATSNVPATDTTARTGRVGEWINGYIHGFRITRAALYDGAFTPTDTTTTTANTILQLNTDNAGIWDSAGTGTGLLLKGGAKVSTAQWKFGGSSVYLNGTTDYLQSSATGLYTLGTTDFTIETWVRPTSLSWHSAIIDLRPDNTNGRYPLIGISSSGIHYVLESVDQISISTPVAVNQWHHVALCRQNGVVKLYLNGNSYGKSRVDAGSLLAGQLLIGANAFRATAPTTYFAGYIGGAQIIRGYAKYTANFTPADVEF